MTPIDLNYKIEPWWCYKYLECVDAGCYCWQDETYQLITWDAQQQPKVVDFWDPNGVFGDLYSRNRVPERKWFPIVKVIGGCI